MSPVTVRAAAKINLSLGVGPLGDDGYHPLITVYQAIGLYDDLTAAPASAWSVDVSAVGGVDVSRVPLDESNIAVRAGRLLAEHHGIAEAAAISVAKGIPVAGGMAGGSADAAAALVALDRLWELHTPDEVLLSLAGRLGSDVPFALLGGTALGTGHGEAVSPILARPSTWYWVIAIADAGLATPDVYRELDRLRAGRLAPPPLHGPDAVMAAMRQHDPEVLGAALGNDLQAAALVLRPELADVLKAGSAAGAVAGLVSGSGPTCVFLAVDGPHAEEVAAALDRAGVCREVRTARGPMPGARVTS
jgi:4-diphosphocytidyl-2-C-methyl-D-erythritol kinase